MNYGFKVDILGNIWSQHLSKNSGTTCVLTKFPLHTYIHIYIYIPCEKFQAASVEMWRVAGWKHGKLEGDPSDARI